jgi:hypothetical protein
MPLSYLIFVYNNLRSDFRRDRRSGTPPSGTRIKFKLVRGAATLGGGAVTWCRSNKFGYQPYFL